MPNARSSHSVPTPRGGGLAIVITFLAAAALWSLASEYSGRVLGALFGAGAWVAVIGFLDDHGHVPARWRLLAHLIAACWALFWLRGLPPLPLFGFLIDMGWSGNLLAVVYIVWLLNLYNFMDGIDGIAGVEAVTVCLGGMVLYTLPSADDAVWELPMLLSAAVLGFLMWNFPKARIFMGDAGSGFVGIALGILSLEAAWVAPELFWGWVILLGAFIVDATVTLFRRIMRGERFYEAHRSHAYQNASRRYQSHVKVSITFGVINLLWLLPVAVVVSVGWLDGVVGLIVAYAPLVALAVWYRAGVAELVG